MSQFAPQTNDEAADEAQTPAPMWRRVRAAITYFKPGARKFQSLGIELFDLAPDFPRLEAALAAWRDATGAQVVDIEFEQSEDLAPTRDSFGPHRPLH